MSEMLQDIQIDLFLPDLKASTQKKVLHILARYVASQAALSEADLLARLEEKDKTSTFAIGDGLALPNLQLKSLSRPFKALCTLKKPVDFQAADKRGVDVICLVLSPLQDGPLHLRRLARMSRLLKNTDLRRNLRDAPDAKTMKSLLSAPQAIILAA